MSILLVVIHVFVCIALILIVLLQTGKGSDMGAAFGGGASQTLFGTTGASSILSKATTAAAIVFMLTSLMLAYMAGNRGEQRLLTDSPPAVQRPIESPATESVTPQPEQTNEGQRNENPPTNQ